MRENLLLRTLPTHFIEFRISMQKSMLSVHVFCLAIVVAIIVIAIIIMNYVHIYKKESQTTTTMPAWRREREKILLRFIKVS